MTCGLSSIANGEFFNNTPIEKVVLYVPEALLEEYKITYPWSGFGTILPIEPLKFKVDTNTKEAEIESIIIFDETSLEIPETVVVDGVTYSVTSIASGALKDNAIIETVFLPSSLKEIGNEAFAGCAYLSYVAFIESETKCKATAVNYGKIQRVSTRANNDGMRIGERVFADCPLLAYVTIPATVTSIGDNVFDNCEFLENVTCEAVNCPTVNVFGNFPISYATLTIPVGSLPQYSTTNPWSLFGKIQDFDGTTGINNVPASDGNDVKDIYSIDGSKRTATAKGLNIIRTNDGTTRKLMR